MREKSTDSMGAASPGRRAFLVGVAALGAATVGAAAGGGSRRAIDVHHHLLPPAYRARNEATLRTTRQGFESAMDWTVEKTLAALDGAGARAALLSLSAPVWAGDVAAARDASRQANEYGARLVAEHPGRFGYYAVLPLPDTEGSLAELAHGFDRLDCDGVIVSSSYDGRHLGHADFAPVFAELNRRKAVVYVHPVTNACCATQVPDLTPAILEYPTDTTRSIADLMFSGRLKACPDIRFIFSHGGGSIAVLADRLRTWSRVRTDLAARLPADFDTSLRGLHFDTASMTNRASFAALSALAPTSQILFGTDFPFDSVGGQLEVLRKNVSPREFAAITHDNACRLFPRFA